MQITSFPVIYATSTASFLFAHHSLWEDCVYFDPSLWLGRGGPVVTFGLAKGGSLKIDYSLMLNDEVVTLEQIDNYNLYFLAVAVNEEMRGTYYGKFLEGQVFDLTEAEAETMCNSPNIARWQLHGAGNLSHTIVGRDPRAERYTAMLLQCRTGLAASSPTIPSLMSILQLL